MKFYIRSIASISPQSHPGKSVFSNAMVCADPDLNGIVDPKLTRRMSHVIKMGIGAAIEALQNAGNIQLDAIITGTAYGCLDDTGVFLKKQVQQKESMLTPTAFIQSTHNTVGGQIGLLLRCNAYNNTIVHRGFSFEHALDDAMMLLEEGNAKNVLIGAVDELTPPSHTILQRFGLYKNISAADDAELPEKGTIAGEGAAFMVISSEAGAGNIACLKGIRTFYKPGVETCRSIISNFLAEQGLEPKDIDLIITGKNGDTATDHLYDEVLNPIFSNVNTETFKDRTGEYPTASGVALCIAVRKIQDAGNIKRILIYNHYENIHHTLHLVEAC